MGKKKSLSFARVVWKVMAILFIKHSDRLGIFKAPQAISVMNTGSLSDHGHNISSQCLSKCINYITYINEVDKDKTPEKCCAVCSRLLYPEKYCRLSINYKTTIENLFVEDLRNALAHNATVAEIEKISWPLLHYRDHNGDQIQLNIHNPSGRGEEFGIVCVKHKSSGAQCLKTLMDFISGVANHTWFPYGRIGFELNVYWWLSVISA